MANHYSFTSYAARLAAAAAAADPYQYESPYAATSSRYLASPSTAAAAAASLYLSQSGAGAAGGKVGGAVAGYGGVDALAGSSLADSLGAAAIKRRLEALYHQNVLGTHSSIGQSEALYSSNSLVKRPRIDTASHLPIYPQRPGEKDCTHYMLTRTCKFGENCKFDHPLWVPEGGIPDWKEVPLATPVETLPERPGETDCPYFVKTKKCKFGSRCKFNHPKELLNGTFDAVILPERPSEPICSFYAKTGKCKFGVNCIFHHPKDIQIPAAVAPENSVPKESAVTVDIAVGDLKPAKTFVPPAMYHNSKGLPLRIGEQDCPFYLKTGSCKYGSACRYNHPDITSAFPSVASAVSSTILQNPAVLSAAASLLPNIDPRLTQSALGTGPLVYPQRPGELECDYYMKTGQCKFGEKCRFHHPIDRSTPAAPKQPPVKLTLAGLPRREGSIMCPFYMKTGTCKFGATCKYDHPPPGEVLAANQALGGAPAPDSGDTPEDTTEEDLNPEAE